jgi:hypothetical protein
MGWRRYARCVIWLSSSVLRKQREQRINAIDAELLYCVGLYLMRQCLDAIIWKVPDPLFVQVDIIMISWGMVLKFLN